jgi:nucleoid-associated protein YgaU
MKNLSQSFKLGLLILGLTSMSACSSSKVEETGSPVETAGEVSLDQPAEAATDAVPGADQALDQKTPDALAATPDANAPAAAVPGADPSLDAPVASTPPADAPIADAPVADAPVADAPVTDNVVAVDPVKHSKHSNQVASDGSGYQVKKGDTLMKIAYEQYGDLYRWKEIYEANRGNIKDPNHVPPGTQLSLNGAGMVTIEHNGESYFIKRGDTLGVISNDVYGTIRKWKKLWENNRQLIKDPNKIYAGFYLYYQPEAKLTHEDVAPGLKKDDSAMNAPKVSAAPREPAAAVVVAPDAAAPANTAPAKN